MSEIIVSPELQAIYFEHRNIVASSEGRILTTSYKNTVAIEQVRKIIFEDKTILKGKYFGQSLPVDQAHQDVIDVILDNYSKNLANKNNATTLSDSQGAKLLVKYLTKAAEEGASDVHFEVYSTKTLILARIDGKRYLIGDFPDRATGMGIISYLLLSGHAKDKDTDFVEKDINNANLDQVLQLPQKNEDGEDFTGPRNTEWRLGYIPSPEGGKMTLRWLNKFSKIPTFEEINYEPTHIAIFKKFLSYPSGGCIMGGVTGSGKTTTLAVAISLINRTEKAIHSLEDPIEMKLEGVVQSLIRPNYPINSKSTKTQTQAELSKALLRHDTDGELHSEIRDHDSAMQVSAKAETGQLVFSTLHVSSAQGMAPRLVEMMNVPKELVSAPNLMRLWVYQALVRQVCPYCSVSANEAIKHPELVDTDTNLLSYFAEKHPEKMHVIRVRNPNGCDKCREGESGRLPLVEMIFLDDDDRAYILKRDYQGWKRHLQEKGFKTVKDHAIARILRGETDPVTANNALTEKIIPESTSSIYQEIADCLES